MGAQVWRDQAGGCSSCSDLASQCTGDCIKAALTRDQLKETWDMVFSNSTMCPDVPYVPPAPTPPTPPTPMPAPSPTPPAGNCFAARDESRALTVDVHGAALALHHSASAVRAVEAQ